TGLPATIELSSDDIYSSLEEPLRAIVDAIKRVLEITPPELAADIVNNGMTLTGGGSLLDGMVQLIQSETQVPVRLAEDPLTCVARGTGEVLERLDELTKRAALTSLKVMSR